ncbi:hypothetical protein Nepgr_031236 [Nepenthes gracilis]|uniref:Pentatricopeptide repeat-containing protein n=1 Tax=Nepenthes gracilis TaxID=150966 RepID=A0AAD3TI34_NEPGR|nr:hypothetical protein Nepgr_031236 [Nepenthes gracilis]
MQLSQLVFRPITARGSRLWSSVSLSSLFIPEKDPVHAVVKILEKTYPIEPALDRIAHTLSLRIISSVLQRQVDAKVGFRFIIWAMKRRRLRTWELHDLIIEVIRKDGGFEVYGKVLEELRSCGVSIPSDAFLVLISSFWKVGIPEKAVESFGMMREFECKPDVFTYNAILYVMVQKEVFLLALAVYNQMLKSNCSPNRATYSILIDGLCKSGKTQDAVNMFDEMTQRGISPDNVTYTIVLSGLCHAKRPSDAQMLFFKMTNSGCCPDMTTYNTLLGGFCKLGRMDEAFMLLRSFESNGYALGLKGYSCIIDGLFKVGRFEDANKWFRKLCEGNIVPDIALYTIMIRGFSQAGRIKDCSRLLQEMTERGLIPDTQCYNTLIKGFCDMGLLDDARSLKLQISENDCFPDACTYTILICGMCRNGLIEEAKKIFEEMEKLGCFPSIVTFNSLIDGLCKAGELEEARLLFYKMEIGRNPSLFLRLSQGADRVLDSTSLQSLVERLCDSGLFLKAYRLLIKLADNGVMPNIITYNILINGMCKSGNINGAFKLFKELQLKGHSPDSVTYGTLIDGLYRADREDDALAVFDQMEKNGSLPTPAIYRSLMKWFCRRRKVSMAFCLWVKYLRSLKNRDNKVVNLAEECFQKGELTLAVKGLLEMDFKLKEIDLAPYTIWLIGMCQARRVEEALKIFHMLNENSVNVTAPSCVMLIHSLCQEGKMDMAVDVFRYTMEKGFKLMPRICNKLVTFLLHSQENRKHTSNILNEMEYAGYDLNTHLFKSTKSLLHNHLNADESAKAVELSSPKQMASLHVQQECK